MNRIFTLLRIYWTNLRRDRVAQAMTFLLPISFFTTFALIFGGRHDATSRVTVAVADVDRTAVSQRLVRALQADKSLDVRLNSRPAKNGRGAAARATRGPRPASDEQRGVRGSAQGDAQASVPESPLDRARALAMVRTGEVPVAIVLPAGLDTSFARFDRAGRAVELLSDPSDPVAAQMVSGLLQKAALTAAPDLLARNGIADFERYAGGLTPGQRQAVNQWLPRISGKGSDSASGAGAGTGLVSVHVMNVVGDKKDNGMVSFYAAGIAVMFLLFSASSGGGALLDEIDSGTLERVLTSRVGMNGLLAGKWLFLTLLGMLQITVMFVWGMVAFRLDLLSHLPGFAVMTVATAATAAGFGLLLASACRTRAQLGGISTILILTISAFGGSMFPRFLMSESMQKMSLVAFNSWALDGYVKVFWRDARVADLWPQLAFLAGSAVVFLAVARLLARRWESA